jgi:hypothetical protein
MRVEDFEVERIEVLEEASVGCEDIAGLTLSTSFNGGSLVQLEDRCPLPFFKPDDRTS